MSKEEPFRRHRHTKVVATLGPSSDTYETIKALFENGADVFRMNFSHGVAEDHKKRLEHIRRLEKEFGRSIGVFADLQGPKIRIGTFQDERIDLDQGQKFTLDNDKAPGNKSRVYLPHPEIFDAISVGEMLLLDDGKVHLKVKSVSKDKIETEVIAGKKLSNRKGVNLPDTILRSSPLTEKDRKDLEVALDMGVDWIALSFVQKPEDIAEARKLINGRASLISKVEKPSAVTHLKEIIDLSDAVMLARGDLGVEIPAQKVPAVQKRAVRMAREAGRPIIIATQMLESMVTSPTPTRAEASDVATAIYDGTDAVMLSAETAAGDYPVEAVSMMRKIARDVEQDDLYRTIMDAEHPDPKENASDAITAAAHSVAQTINAAAIVNYTTSGSTALRTARERPSVPILCLTENLAVARRMALSYGVHAVHTKDVDNFGDMVKKAIKVAKQEGLAEKGERLVITAGVPFGTPGSTNILRIAWVD
jgi:pyruvate kinase